MTTTQTPTDADVLALQEEVQFRLDQVHDLDERLAKSQARRPTIIEELARTAEDKVRKVLRAEREQVEEDVEVLPLQRGGRVSDLQDALHRYALAASQLCLARSEAVRVQREAVEAQMRELQAQLDTLQQQGLVINQGLDRTIVLERQLPEATPAEVLALCNQYFPINPTLLPLEGAPAESSVVNS